MALELIAHLDLEDQVCAVFMADPKDGPISVARIRALLESFDEDLDLLEPARSSEAVGLKGLIVETRAATASGIASRNLCQSLLAQVQELTWPF